MGINEELNEELKKLAKEDRVKILKFFAKIRLDADEIDENLGILIAKVFIYRIENDMMLPEELNPEKWHLPQ